jgi:hypothetical protein
VLRVLVGSMVKFPEVEKFIVTSGMRNFIDNNQKVNNIWKENISTVQKRSYPGAMSEQLEVYWWSYHIPQTPNPGCFGMKM